MDLRMFYQKIRQTEQEIPKEHVVVVSHETPDGGVAGRTTEVRRKIAAQLVVEGRARLATGAEAAAHQAEMEARRLAAEELALAERGLTVVLGRDEIAARRPKKETKG